MSHSDNASSGKIILYTDGSSRGNPGPGGFGVLLMYGNHRKEIAQGYRLTTNNRMELMAVIAGLEAIKNNQIPVHIFTDSQYVINAVQKGWLNTWMKTNFKGGKKNPDLWKKFFAISRQFQLEFSWVKGHGSNPFNNRCDELATAVADQGPHAVDDGYEQGLAG